MKRKFFMWIICGIGLTGHSQYNSSGFRQFEIGGGAGIANYSGDIGSKISTILPSAEFGIRNFVNEHIAFNGRILYAQLKGDDKITDIPRGLSFKTQVGEISGGIEVYLFKAGSKFKHYSSYRGSGTKKINFFASLSAGVIVFFPELDLNSNQEYEKKSFEKLSYVIPIGGGIRYNVNKRIAFSVSVQNRLTITDYLDEYEDNKAKQDRYLVCMFDISYKLKHKSYL